METIKIQKMLSLDDSIDNEYEIITPSTCALYSMSVGLKQPARYHEIKRRRRIIGYYFITTELNQIIRNVFLQFDPSQIDLEFEGQLFNPAISIMAAIPKELQQIVPPIFFEYEEIEKIEKERQRRIAEERRRREEETRIRLIKEAEERQKREEERRKKEEEEKEKRKRQILIESPRKVLKLSPDCPDWLVEIYWRALVKAIHPDRHNGSANKEHLTKMLSLINEAHDKIKNQRGPEWNPKKVPWEQQQ